VIAPDGDGPLVLTWRYAPAPDAPRYPEAAWTPRPSRWTTSAEDLVAASRAIAEAAGGGAAGLAALAAETRARFVYDHPEARFTDGCAVVPFLGCGVAAGSCVDINTYLVASLRAAGYEAAYLYGYFFPAEKGDWCVDGHCWVATRHAGETLDWDIAHHIKAGLDPVRPALNPKPGRRVAVSHSMGHRYRLGDREAKRWCRHHTSRTRRRALVHAPGPSLGGGKPRSIHEPAAETPHGDGAGERPHIRSNAYADRCRWRLLRSRPAPSPACARPCVGRVRRSRAGRAA
jgi:hypothetical protein